MTQSRFDGRTGGSVVTFEQIDPCKATRSMRLGIAQRFDLVRARIKFAAYAPLMLGMAAGVQAQSPDPCPCSEKKECPKPAGSITSGKSGLSYPIKPIRIVVPFAAGGSTDLQTRQVASKLTERLGVQVVVDNQPGSAGLIGSAAVARAAPDGYTLLVGTVGSNVIAPQIYEKVPFDPIRDLLPIASMFASSYVLVVNPSNKAKTTKELVELLKSQPGKVTFASSGIGGLDHLAAELLQQATGTKMAHIPYKGSGPALTDLLGDQVQVMFLPLSLAVEPVKSGRLRALGISSAYRSRSLPQVPTFDEAGFNDFVVKSWTGVFAPTNTPGDVAEKLNTEINRVLSSGDASLRQATQPADPCPQPSAVFNGLLRESASKWKILIKQAGIKAE